MAVSAWIICSGLIGKEEVEQVRLEEGCQRYIEKALPPILESWNFAEWKRRASSELLASSNLKRLAKEFKDYPKLLGEPKRISKPVGRVVVDESGGISETLGLYTVSCRFEMGHADIAVRVVKRKGGWKFQQFMIRSDALPSSD